MKLTCVEYSEGGLGPNPLNPFDGMDPVKRRADAIEELGRILGEILAEKAGAPSLRTMVSVKPLNGSMEKVVWQTGNARNGR